jgi:hypothetical protein
MSLYQRGVDGFPVPSDAYLRESYGKIPDAELFQKGSGYGYDKPTEVHGWQWSTTFNRWSALVTFKDGWHGYTYPAPWRKHHNDCPHCGMKLSRHSPNGVDVIYECPNETGMHHRHMICGVSGEYVSMRPLSRSERGA